MSERDDELLRLYGAVPREVPPPALDAAILAASRRSVRAPAAPRWAAGLSVAAVLILALGLVLKVQREAPDAGMPVDSRERMPAAMPARPAAPAQSPAPPAEREAAPRSEPAPAAPAAHDAIAPERRAQSLRKPKVEAKRVAPPKPDAARAEESAVMSAPAIAPAPAAAAAPSAAGVAAEKSGAADALRANAAPPARAVQKSLAVDPLQRELERIARLREEGRNDEADTALGTFKREHPDYRIEPEMLERVRRR